MNRSQALSDTKRPAVARVDERDQSSQPETLERVVSQGGRSLCRIAVAPGVAQQQPPEFHLGLFTQLMLRVTRSPVSPIPHPEADASDQATVGSPLNSENAEAVLLEAGVDPGDRVGRLGDCRGASSAHETHYLGVADQRSIGIDITVREPPKEKPSGHEHTLIIISQSLFRDIGGFRPEATPDAEGPRIEKGDQLIDPTDADSDIFRCRAKLNYNA